MLQIAIYLQFVMQFLQTIKNNGLEPIHSFKKIKSLPVSTGKIKRPSELVKIKSESPNKKIQKPRFSNCNSLELHQFINCGGMKLNTRLNASAEKKKPRLVELKDRTCNLEKINLGMSTAKNYLNLYAYDTINFMKKSILFENPEEERNLKSLPLIEKQLILIRRQSVSNKGKELIGFYQAEHCHVSLYKCQDAKLKIIDHPNIVGAYGLYRFQENRSDYYVADLFEGLTLKNLVIEFGPLGEHTAKIYLRQLLLAVHQLHLEHQPHNRINMDNIFHDKMGKVLLNNFKSSQQPLSETEKSLYLYYFPPESLLSRNNMSSEKNDIWGIGCITLQMLVPKSIKLSKYHPYNKNISGKSLNESTIILDKIKTIVQSKYQSAETNIESDDNSQLSALALDFITKCLSIKIDLRPNIAELMGHPFVSE